MRVKPTKYLIVRVAPDVRAKFAQACALRGITMSDSIRQHVEKASK